MRAGVVVVLGWLLLMAAWPTGVAATDGNPPPAGPPYPQPVAGQSVYDYAGVFSAATVAASERAITEIEARTGTEIVVYTQLKPGATTASTELDARALMDEWGVGHARGDDGLVILWNLDETLKHGQVQLFAGVGFRDRVSNGQRQAIFDNEMLPLLKQGDLDGAMLTAIDGVDALLAPPATDMEHDVGDDGQKAWVVGSLALVWLAVALARPRRASGGA